jgi:hypothetical protein
LLLQTRVLDNGDHAEQLTRSRRGDEEVQRALLRLVIGDGCTLAIVRELLSEAFGQQGGVVVQAQQQ